MRPGRDVGPVPSRRVLAQCSVACPRRPLVSHFIHELGERDGVSAGKGPHRPVRIRPPRLICGQPFRRQGATSQLQFRWRPVDAHRRTAVPVPPDADRLFDQRVRPYRLGLPVRSGRRPRRNPIRKSKITRDRARIDPELDGEVTPDPAVVFDRVFLLEFGEARRYCLRTRTPRRP